MILTMDGKKIATRSSPSKYAFIEFATEEEAIAAKTREEGRLCKGMSIEIHWSRSAASCSPMCLLRTKETNWIHPENQMTCF